MTKVRVYGFGFDGERRAVIATTSWAKAAAAFNVPVGRARTYGSITGNAEECTQALARPEVPFVCVWPSRVLTEYTEAK